jgi:hypothetical protein
VGLGGHERSDGPGRAAAPAGNGGGTALLALRLQTVQAIAQGRCGAAEVWRAGALPFSIAAAIAPAILAIGSGSYGVLYMVAGLCAIIGVVTILPVKRVR